MTQETFIKIRNQDGYISADPIPSDKELSKFYSEKYYQDPQTSSYQLEYPQVELDYRRLKYSSMLYAAEQHVKKTDNVQKQTFLDIGAGEGFFLKVAHEKGYNVRGIDFSSFGVSKFHPELLDNLTAGDSFEVMDSFIRDDRKFDICSTVNVLEHVRNPDEFLTKIKKLLKPESILTITVPNDYSTLQEKLVSEGYIDREFWFLPPQHLHYFNSENLIPFLESKGFICVDAFSDFPIDLFLLNPDSNYVMDKSKGPNAHKARMNFDLLIANKGLENYLNYYRAIFKVGIGRNITVLLKLK
jgi:2-polyprenyl-3-methyl-5-hydroxy-6-metoxy-1,4-benzoquinol methylase